MIHDNVPGSGSDAFCLCRDCRVSKPDNCYCSVIINHSHVFIAAAPCHRIGRIPRGHNRTKLEFIPCNQGVLAAFLLDLHGNLRPFCINGDAGGLDSYPLDNRGGIGRGNPSLELESVSYGMLHFVQIEPAVLDLLRLGFFVITEFTAVGVKGNEEIRLPIRHKRNAVLQIVLSNFYFIDIVIAVQPADKLITGPRRLLTAAKVQPLSRKQVFRSGLFSVFEAAVADIIGHLYLLSPDRIYGQAAIRIGSPVRRSFCCIFIFAPADKLIAFSLGPFHTDMVVPIETDNIDPDGLIILGTVPAPAASVGIIRDRGNLFPDGIEGRIGIQCNPLTIKVNRLLRILVGIPAAEFVAVILRPPIIQLVITREDAFIVLSFVTPYGYFRSALVRIQCTAVGIIAHIEIRRPVRMECHIAIQGDPGARVVSIQVAVGIPPAMEFVSFPRNIRRAVVCKVIAVHRRSNTHRRLCILSGLRIPEETSVADISDRTGIHPDRIKIHIVVNTVEHGENFVFIFARIIPADKAISRTHRLFCQQVIVADRLIGMCFFSVALKPAIARVEINIVELFGHGPLRDYRITVVLLAQTKFADIFAVQRPAVENVTGSGRLLGKAQIIPVIPCPLIRLLSVSVAEHAAVSFKGNGIDSLPIGKNGSVFGNTQTVDRFAVYKPAHKAEAVAFGLFPADIGGLSVMPVLYLLIGTVAEMSPVGVIGHVNQVFPDRIQRHGQLIDFDRIGKVAIGNLVRVF